MGGRFEERELIKSWLWMMSYQRESVCVCGADERVGKRRGREREEKEKEKEKRNETRRKGERTQTTEEHGWRSMRSSFWEIEGKRTSISLPFGTEAISSSTRQ